MASLLVNFWYHLSHCGIIYKLFHASNVNLVYSNLSNKIVNLIILKEQALVRVSLPDSWLS